MWNGYEPRSTPTHDRAPSKASGFRSLGSDSEFVGLRQYHLQDGHERRRLAEVAVADDVGVDVEALCVASGLYAPDYVV